MSTIPLVLPYRVAKLTHMEHHKHANHPELDPDDPVLAGAFRTPSLRNVEKTAPYFHDGSVATLPEAVRLINELPALFDQAYPKAYRALIGLDQGAIRRKG